MISIRENIEWASKHLHRVFSEKGMLIWGHFFFAVMLVLSAWHYLPRVLSYDSSAQLFKIIYFDQINIEASRYSTFLTQLPTRLALWLELPLRWVLLIFSVSFTGVYYIVFLLNAYWLKHTKAALLTVLVLTLGVTHNFFYIVTETHQALVYSTLFYAWINMNRPMKPIWDYLGAILVAALAFFAHPVATFTLLFAILHKIVFDHGYKNAKSYILISLVGVLVVLKAAAVESSSYEGNLLGNINEMREVLKNWRGLYPFTFVLHRIQETYLMILLVAILALVMHAKRNAFFKFSILGVYIFGFFVLTAVIYHAGDCDAQMEKDFMPLSFMLGILVLHWIDHERNLFNRGASGTLVVAVFFHLFLMNKTARVYYEKLDFYQQIISQAQGHDKNLIPKAMLSPTVFVNWPLSTETLMLSALEGPENSTTFFVAEHLPADLNISDSTLFLYASWWPQFSTDQLPKHYFDLEGTYQNFPQP